MRICLRIAMALLGAGLGAQSPLTTTFASNNGGAVGGAVYFNLTTGVADVCIAAIGLNCGNSIGTAGTLNMWTIANGSYVGNTQAGVAGWGGIPVATGSFLCAGPDNESFCALDSALVLSANTVYAVALEAPDFSFRYTDGDGSTGVPGSGTNQTFGNPLELLFEGGAAGNQALTGPAFDPRIANVNIYYTLGPGLCVAAEAVPYGSGCYSVSVSYYEEFQSGASDYGGQAGAYVDSLIHVPNGVGGYWVGPGSGAWFGEDGSGANTASAVPGAVPLAASDLGAGDDTVSTVDLTTAAPAFSWSVAGVSGIQTELSIDSNGRIAPGRWLQSDFSASVAELLHEAPSIAAAWTDMSPNEQGAVHFDYDGFTCYVTWADVPFFGNGGQPGNNIQVALSYAGIYELRWAGMAAQSGYLVGFSTGMAAADPGPSDISSLAFGGQNFGGFSAPLALSSNGRPITGTMMTLTVGNISATTSAVLLRVGFVQNAVGLDLTPFGMAGCRAYIDLASSVLLDLVVPTGSQSAFGFQSPVGFEEAQLYFQAGALDPAVANGLGATVSNGLYYRLGNL